MSKSPADRGERFLIQPVGILMTQCLLCARVIDTDDPYQVCQAFPAGVPDAITRNLVDHRKPYPGDHGIQFEPRPDAQPDILRNTMAALDALPG